MAITKDKESSLRSILYFSVSAMIGASLVGLWLITKE